MNVRNRESFDAVVIGASAGGVEALGKLLSALPAQLAVPVAIVIHLPADKPSLLAEVLSHKCALPVREAEDKEPALPGVVYLAPPDYHLLVETRTAFALSTEERVLYSRPSIDVLFESAVDVFGRRLLGILLTGANSDGAQGLAAIHAAGGVTAVQDPATAVAPEMPLAALQKFQPDYVLPLDRLANLVRGGAVQGGPLA